MANILVYIELSGDRPAAASLEALGEGRRIASFVGATLYAVLPCSKPPRYGDDDIIAVLGRHGADKVILTSGPEPGTPPLYLTHGNALVAALERVPAALVLVAATAGGRDLAPRAAARLGAAFVPEPSVEYGRRGELVLSRSVYGGRYRRRLGADEVERPIVVTLTPGSHTMVVGDEEAEVILLDGLGAEPIPALAEIARADDPGAALETSQVVVVAGAGVGASEYALLADLATALGGELAVTHGAVERGLGSQDREVGIGARHVSPRLYVVFAASGSPEHLGAVSADAQIVAINRDPEAPIFKVASYGLVGEIADVAPALLAAARAGRS